MTRLALCFAACVAGCSPGSQPAFYAAPSEVTGATLKGALPDEADRDSVRLSAVDARAVYAALKSGEAEILDGAYAWAAGYVITFETEDGDEIGAYLKFDLELWMPQREPHDGDRGTPETAKTILSKYAWEGAR